MAGMDLDQLRRLAGMGDGTAARELEIRLRLPEPPARPYPHSSECRTPHRDPEWTVDIDAADWRRGPCDGATSCTLVQHHETAAPPPPRPDDDKLADFEATHGSAHTELRLEIASGDRYGHWRARCTGCGATAAWWTEAARHYEAHGLRISTRPMMGILELGVIDANPR
jgi:hypothetical protein